MKREVKIGIFAVAMIGVAWAGIRFLKGFDIFSRNVEYYAAYDQINGVQNASPIMMKGVKIGSVTRLSFDPARSDKVVLQFTIKRQYRIPTDSEAKIFSLSLIHICSSGYSVECAAGTITGSAGHGVIFESLGFPHYSPRFCLGDAYGLRFGAFVRQCDGAGTFLALICVYCERNAVDVVNE